MSKQYKNIHQELIDKCRKNDQRAQFEIYKTYYKAMYNTSLHIVNNAVEAEDVMQESFLSAFENIKSYRGDVSFGAWLKKIVVNCSLDVLKKKKIQLSTIEPEKYELAEGSSDSDYDFIQTNIEKIKNAIEQLTDGYRIVLSLYLLEGYDHDEIASILTISPSSSRSQLSRAKKKLIQLIR